jgi:phage-related holin
MKIKILSLIVPLIIFAPFVRFFEKYIWDDWQFAATMVLLVGIDTALGTLYAYKTKELSSKKMGGLGVKVIVYGLSLATIHNITHHTVHGEPNTVLASILPWMDATLYAYFVIREVMSINEKCGKLGYPIFPKFITKRFEDFDENGNFNPQNIKNDNNN